MAHLLSVFSGELRDASFELHLYSLEAFPFKLSSAIIGSLASYAQRTLMPFNSTSHDGDGVPDE